MARKPSRSEKVAGLRLIIVSTYNMKLKLHTTRARTKHLQTKCESHVAFRRLCRLTWCYVQKEKIMNIFKNMVVIAALLVSLVANADTRCSTDYFGNITCRSSDGSTLRGSTDYFGNETWRDNSGNTIRGTTDYFGNKTYRDNSGNSYRGSTDYFGNETWRGSDGNTIRGTTDYFGNRTYRDSSGNTTRCSTDYFGNVNCR